MEVINFPLAEVNCIKDDFVIIDLGRDVGSKTIVLDSASAYLLGSWAIIKPNYGFIGVIEVSISGLKFKINVLNGPSRKYENISYKSAIEILKCKACLDDEEVVGTIFGRDVKSVDDLKLLYSDKKLDGYVVLNRFKTSIDTEKKLYYFQNYKPYDVSGYINWGENKPPYDTRSWKYSFNAMFFLDQMVEAGQLDYALDIMKSWVKFNIQDNKFNAYAWYDMGVAIRAPKLAYLFKYALINQLLTDGEIVDFTIALQAHLTDLCDENKLALHSNHGLYQLSGILGLVNILPEIKNSKEIEAFATKLFCDVAHKDINDEGMHIEHSPAYHVFMLEMMTSLIECGWLKDISLINKLELMKDNAKYIFHPDHKYVRFGDTSNRIARHVLPKQLFESIFLKKEDKGLQEDNKILPESGYAYFRTGGWDEGNRSSFLAFSAAFHKRTHKHADDFTFEWSELGKKILIDAGMFGYQRDAIEREYVQSTRAHNCVEIDEQDYSRYNLDIFGSAISAWSSCSGVKLVEANLFRKRFFKTNHRRIVLLKPNAWLLVIDHLKSGDAHKFTQWFHIDPSLSLNQNLNDIFIDLETDERLWVNNLSEGEDINHISAQFEPRLQGWTSVEPYKLTPNDALGFTVEDKKEHTFATLFSFGNELERPDVEMFKSSSNGKYLRAKWKAPNGEVEDIIYRISAGNRELTINGEIIDVEVREA
jgi:hypothetical protein